MAYNVTGGASYRFKYRAQNFNGWGQYSEIAYIQAATIPGIPPAPIYVSSTATTTTLQFLEPEDLGGSPLTGFKLYANSLSLNENDNLIYSGTDTTVTVSTSDGLTSGITYRYVLVASNAFGDSAKS